MYKKKIPLYNVFNCILIVKNNVKYLIVYSEKKKYILYIKLDKNIKMIIEKNSLYMYSKNKYILSTQYIYICKLIEDFMFNFYDSIILKGSGYKCKLAKNKKYLLFNLGYSHIIYIKIPWGIYLISIEKKNTIINFCTINRLLLKQYINILKKLRRVNIYKGKGLFYLNQKIFIKKQQAFDR